MLRMLLSDLKIGEGWSFRFLLIIITVGGYLPYFSLVHAQGCGAPPLRPCSRPRTVTPPRSKRSPRKKAAPPAAQPRQPNESRKKVKRKGGTEDIPPDTPKIETRVPVVKSKKANPPPSPSPGSSEQPIKDCILEKIGLPQRAQGALALGRGKDAVEAGNYDRGYKEFSNAIRFNPCQSEAYYHRGLILEDRRQPDAAFDNYSAALKIDKKYAEAFTNRGGINWNSKLNPEAAIKDYTDAILCCKDYDKIARTYLNRGKIYSSDYFEDHEKAIKDFDFALQKAYPKSEEDNTYLQAFIERGKSYFSQKKFEEAIREYDKALKLAPNNPDAKTYRAVASTANEAFLKRITDLTAKKEKEPNNAERYYELGNAFREYNRFDEALQNYDEAIRLNREGTSPYVTYSYLNRGKTHYVKGNYQIARPDLEAVIRRELAKLDTQTDETKKTEEKGRNKILQEARFLKARSYAAEGNFEEAIKIYDTIISEFPTFAVDIYYYRALANIAKENFEAAVSDLEKYKANDDQTIRRGFLRRAAIYDQISEREKDETRAELFKQKAEEERSRAKKVIMK